VSGTVADSTGGVLPGVVVTAVHEASGNSFEAVTDGQGRYRLAVRVGTYRILASLPGFATLTRTGLELLVGQQAAVNLTLIPAALEESVTVTAEAPLVDVTRSNPAGNIDPRQMQELPLNGRNWMDLTMLAPGSRQNSVYETPVDVSGSNVNFQINIDGQQVTNAIALGFGQPRFSRDAIAEFEFISNRFDARQGRTSGVQVNAITKSGTNTFSGSFAGYFRNDRFNAPDPVVGEVLPYSDTQLSATFGGPIRKDRMHFFANYEWEREPASFAYTTPYPKFNDTLTAPRREDKYAVRLDFQFSPQTRLSVRGGKYANRFPYDPRYTGGSVRTPASAIGVNRNSEQVFFTFTQVLSNRAVHEIRVGHDAFFWNQYAHVKNPNSLPGMTQGFGAPVILLRGFTLGQNHRFSPQELGQDVTSVRYDLTYSLSKGGRHDINLGGEFLRDFTFETVCQVCMGLYDMRGGPVPANLEELIPDVYDVSTWNLNALSSITRFYERSIAMASSTYSRPTGASGFTEYAPRKVYAGWVQDNWTVTPRLTLNLGLRYDLTTGAYVEWVDFPPFLEGGRSNDTNNFGPRLGFAYSLTDRTVLRGGYGKYLADVTDQPAIFTLRQVQQIRPRILNDGRPDFVSNPFNGPAPTYEQATQLLCTNNPAPGCLEPTLDTNFAANDLEFPYSYQGSVGMQRQLTDDMALEMDYVFTASRATLGTENVNLAYDPDTGANYNFADKSKRPHPGWGQTNILRNLGKSNYHGLQVSLKKRLSNRWQAAATYLLSGEWQFDNLPLAPGCQYPTTTPSPGVFRCDVPIELAPDVSENAYYLTGAQRHRLTLNGIWDAGYGFQLSGLYIFGDNGWATPDSGVDVRQVGTGATRLRPNGTLIERNSFDRQSLHRVDMRIQRRFNLPRMALDGIFEVFNVFNRANYQDFVLNESSASFGQPEPSSNIAYAPRMLQLGFRVTF